MGIEQLAEALAMCDGMVVTPELSMQILSYSSHTPENVEYLADTDFPEKEYQGYTVKLTKMADHLEEIEYLHRTQWDEIEEHRPPLSPDYNRFLSLEKSGGFVQVGVFLKEKMVGGCGFFVYPSIHTQLMVAEESALYLLPEHRKGMLALVLMRYCKNFFQKIGVSEVTATVKSYANTGKMLKRLGFRQTDSVYLLTMGA
jgi:GNAT superfamily N-acetyltransferase